MLGHKRLAIFDLSEAGSQPMLIYNFRDLRIELESKGYGFESHADTEILIHGYREWRIDGLASRIRGMFAFGLWDTLRGSVPGARWCVGSLQS